MFVSAMMTRAMCCRRHWHDHRASRNSTMLWLNLVCRASPVPVPPPDVNKTITAPVRFTVR
jgi:hypothetical protein